MASGNDSQRTSLLDSKQNDEIVNSDDLRLLTEGVLETLRKPLTNSDFPSEDIKVLFRLKEQADKNIINGLKKIGFDLPNFSKVKSIFETPGFFSDILDKCQADLDNGDGESDADLNYDNDEDLGGSHYKQNDLNYCKGHQTNKCSVDFGHIRLEPDNLLNPKGLTGPIRDICDDECENLTFNEEVKFTAIDTAPLTINSFNLIDVSTFLSQIKFCRICASNRNKNTPQIKSSIMYNDVINQVKSRSYLKLSKTSLKVRNIDYVNNSPNYEVPSPKPICEPSTSKQETNVALIKDIVYGITSPEITEDSIDSGVFMIYSKSHEVQNQEVDPIEKILEFMHFSEDNSSSVTSKEGKPSGSSLKVIENEIVPKDNISKGIINKLHENISSGDSNFSTSPKEEGEIDDMVDFTEEVKVIHEATRQKNNEKSLYNVADKTVFNGKTSPNFLSLSRKTPHRKVYVTKREQFSKNKIKRSNNRKVKKKKKSKKASINLSPPPGVDIDEYLQQQVLLIKAQLKSQGDFESSNNGMSKKELSSLNKDKHKSKPPPSPKRSSSQEAHSSKVGKYQPKLKSGSGFRKRVSGSFTESISPHRSSGTSSPFRTSKLRRSHSTSLSLSDSSPERTKYIKSKSQKSNRSEAISLGRKLKYSSPRRRSKSRSPPSSYESRELTKKEIVYSRKRSPPRRYRSPLKRRIRYSRSPPRVKTKYLDSPKRPRSPSPLRIKPRYSPRGKMYRNLSPPTSPVDKYRMYNKMSRSPGIIEVEREIERYTVKQKYKISGVSRSPSPVSKKEDKLKSPYYKSKFETGCQGAITEIEIPTVLKEVILDKLAQEPQPIQTTYSKPETALMVEQKVNAYYPPVNNFKPKNDPPSAYYN